MLIEFAVLKAIEKSKLVDSELSRKLTAESSARPLNLNYKFHRKAELTFVISASLPMTR